MKPTISLTFVLIALTSLAGRAAFAHSDGEEESAGHSCAKVARDRAVKEGEKKFDRCKVTGSRATPGIPHRFEVELGCGEDEDKYFFVAIQTDGNQEDCRVTDVESKQHHPVRK